MTHVILKPVIIHPWEIWLPINSFQFFTGTSYIEYFKGATWATNPDAVKIWERTKENSDKQIIQGKTKIEEALLDDGKNVFFGSEINTVVNFDSVPCNVSSKSDDFFEVSLAWALQKESQYRHLFNFHLTKIKESGQMSRLTSKYVSR